MNKEYYQLKTSYCVYVVEIWHQYPGIDKVFIGGKKKCVTFSIYLEDKESPNLDGFGYNEECNKQGNHIKGIGSIHLLNVAMLFVLKHYGLPRDTRFQFKDTSFIECSTYKQSLPVYYTVFYGKTWYESKFDAIPLYISQDEFKEQRKKLRDYLKTKPPIEEWFFGSEKLRKQVEEIYIRVNSLQECLLELKEFDCCVFKNWLSALVLKFIPVLIGTEWYVQCQSDIAIKIKRMHQPVQISKMDGGNLVLSFKQSEIF